MSLGEFTRTCPDCGAMRYIDRKLFTGAKLESPVRLCPECGCKVMLLTSKEWCQRGPLGKFLLMIPWWGWIATALIAGGIVYLLPFPQLRESVPYILAMAAVMLPMLAVIAVIRCNRAAFLEKLAASVLRGQDKQYRGILQSAGKLRGNRVPLLVLTKKNRAYWKKLIAGGKTGSFNSGSLFEP